MITIQGRKLINTSKIINCIFNKLATQHRDVHHVLVNLLVLNGFDIQMDGDPEAQHSAQALI